MLTWINTQANLETLVRSTSKPSPRQAISQFLNPKMDQWKLLYFTNNRPEKQMQLIQNHSNKMNKEKIKIKKVIRIGTNKNIKGINNFSVHRNKIIGIGEVTQINMKVNVKPRIIKIAKCRQNRIGINFQDGQMTNTIIIMIMKNKSKVKNDLKVNSNQVQFIVVKQFVQSQFFKSLYCHHSCQVNLAQFLYLRFQSLQCQIGWVNDLWLLVVLEKYFYLQFQWTLWGSQSLDLDVWIMIFDACLVLSQELESCSDIFALISILNLYFCNFWNPNIILQSGGEELVWYFFEISHFLYFLCLCEDNLLHYQNWVNDRVIIELLLNLQFQFIYWHIHIIVSRLFSFIHLLKEAQVQLKLYRILQIFIQAKISLRFYILQFYSLKILKIRMEAIENYEIISVIGEGAFGKVYKAYDQDKNIVAIKAIKFQNQDEGIPSTALRQISILKSLKNHPYIVPLKEIIYKHKQQNLKIIFDFYEYDLKKFIHSKDYQISQQQSKKIIKKILSGIAYCHGRKVLHRDLKPQNILIDNNDNVKIADFGLARLLMIPQKTLTHEVETLWYRAPQILLGQKNYTFAVDVWAVGCIFAELFLKRPLFLGNGYQIEQIFKIFQILGTPKQLTWPNLQNLPDFKFTFPKWQKQPLQNHVNLLSAKGIQFLQLMLQLNPGNRITAAQALQHQYLADIQLQK